MVLGASGFIGRNLFEYLQSKGYNVSGQQYSKSQKDLINCDLTDYNITKLLLRDTDYVFMMAAKTFGLGLLKASPDKLVRDNLVMNANVLQACYELKVKKVFMVSSSVVYQDEHSRVIEEHDLNLNQDPYYVYKGVGWVKRYTEQLAKFYDSLGMKVVTVRPTGVYGKYDKYDDTHSHIIPAIIKKCLSNKELEVWGTGTNIKDFIYVEDFVQDIVSLFEKYDGPEPVNMCSGKLYSIKNIVDMIVKLTGFSGEIEYNTNKPETIGAKILSNKKLTNIIGKRNYIDLSTGLSKTIEWMKNDIIGNPKY